jgi:hypothetical protein
MHPLPLSELRNGLNYQDHCHRLTGLDPGDRSIWSEEPREDVVTILIFASAILLAQSAPTPAAVAMGGPGERIVTATGYYSGVDEGDDGVRLRLDDTPLRFRLPTLSAATLEPLVQLVTNASRRGFALRVRFDGSAGQVDAQGATVTYPLCSLSVGNVAPLGDESVNCPAALTPGPRDSLATLARGVAIGRTHAEASVPLLGEALADVNLAPSLRAVALRERGEAEEALADDRAWGSEAFDRLMIAALTDYRSRVAIDPNNADAQYAVGQALTDLGAYDEALAVYANIGRRWAEEAWGGGAGRRALFFKKTGPPPTPGWCHA